MVTASPSAEKRKHKRRPILESFSLFVTIPKKGDYKLPVHDISDGGIAFNFDIEGESAEDYPLKEGEKFDIHFYLNQSLYLPLKVKVMRVSLKGDVRQVGAELVEDSHSKESKSLQAFLGMLDAIVESARFT